MTTQHKNTQIISVSEGRATLEDGTTIDLLKIQAALNYAFQSQGSNLFAEASNALSQITGLQQSAHGEFLPSETIDEGPKSEPTVAQEPVAFVDANGDLIPKVKLAPWTDLYTRHVPVVERKPVAFCVEFNGSELGKPTMDRAEAEATAALVPGKRRVINLFREELAKSEGTSLPEASTAAVEPVSEEHARLVSLKEKAEKLEAWDDMPEYCREDWQHEVREGDTNLGYKEWVINQIDMAILECTHA